MVDTSAFAFANRGTISLSSSAPSVSVTLGVVKDIEITVSAEHVNLYGWGSIKRQAVAKHSAKVAVKIGYVKFDPIKTTGWQMLAWSQTNGTTPGTAGTLVDTNYVPLFTVVGLFQFEAGVSGSPAEQKLYATVSGVYFPNFPLKTAEGQWMKVDMVGEGSDVVFSNV